MLNLSDKELDRLSREAADLYEPDDSSLSWARLEQKLTEQIPERPPDGFRFGRINPYLWGSAVVLLTGVSFFLIKNNFYSKHSTQTNQSVNHSIPSSLSDQHDNSANIIRLDSISSAAAIQQNDHIPGEEVKQNDAAAGPGGSGNAVVSSENKNKTSDQIQSNGYPTSENSNSTVKDKNVHRKGSGSKGAIPASAIAAGSIASYESGSSNGANTVLHTEVTDQSASGLTGTSKEPMNTGKDKNRISLPLVVTATADPVMVKGNDSLLKKFTLSQSTLPAKSLRVNRSLNFGLTFGPDYTDAGGISNNQLGNNIGLTIGYYLTSKLSVNTGIIYSNKFYWSEGEGYHHPQPYQPAGNYNTYAYAPPIELVNGSCNMWEIPLTIRYDFTQNKKTKFFANAGLSSYFMMKQSYIFFFHSGYRALALKSNDNQQVNYWFDVANISLGMETDIGKGFSFQVEPFLKLPFKNMGSEELKLNSYGVLLSFRYAPVLSRTKK